MPTSQHRRFDQGFNQDEAPFLLEDGAAAVASNMLFDKLGIARKRGGITGVGATTTYGGDSIGALVQEDGTVRIYSGGIGLNEDIKCITTATGVFGNEMAASANRGLLNPDGARPFQHHGFLFWPCYTTSVGAGAVAPICVAGADGSVADRDFTTPATCVITAGDKRIPCAVANNPLTLMQVGQIITLENGAVSQYIGRVTALISTTAFEVYPTPTIAMAAATSVLLRNSHWPFESSTPGAPYIGSRVGMSFQGRILLGHCSRNDFTGANRLEYFPRRCYFSSLLSENDASGKSMITQGAVFATNQGFPTFNYFDIPGQDPITAMSPTGFGDAIIFSAYRTFRLTGNLSTQFGTSQSFTWTVREIPNSVGCLSERSMQRTPRGVIFAHSSGVYTTDGNSMQPLMFGRIQSYWKALVAGANFKIYGSALVYGNHYYLCGTSGGVLWGLLVNLDTLAWGTLTGKSTAPASFVINSSVQDPVTPSKTWALKWWDETGAKPSMTGGQLLQLETMFAPSSSSRADSDGTTVSLIYYTRSFTEDSPTLIKSWLKFSVEYRNIGGASIRVTPVAALSYSDIVNSGGSLLVLPQQDTYTINAASVAAPIVIQTTVTHGIVADSWVMVVGVTGNSAANGPWRVQAVTGTTITLMGSAGNAAYISGGTVQALSTRDFDLASSLALPNQHNNAGVAYRFTDFNNSGADEFELYGITHSWENLEEHSE